MDEQEPVDYPVDGTLDLHTFRPEDVSELVPEYLHECRKKGIYQVRIVHGKGKGILRSKVHSVLKRMNTVECFRLAGDGAGGWGATIVTLKPLG
ncbi:MAG: Smr/MutS family protein [Spirochaetota bacterium]